MNSADCLVLIANRRQCSEYAVFEDAFAEEWRGVKDPDMLAAAFANWLSGSTTLPSFVERYVIRHCPEHDDRLLPA